MITTFGGGVGAGKFLEGLYSENSKMELNIVVNTADDINVYDDLCVVRSTFTSLSQIQSIDKSVPNAKQIQNRQNKQII